LYEVDFWFLRILNEKSELLATAWMKPDKEEKAPNILLFSKRFNDVRFFYSYWFFNYLISLKVKNLQKMSQLVVTEIVVCTNHQERLEKLEKW
jgi:hypothetical protein